MPEGVGGKWCEGADLEDGAVEALVECPRIVLLLLQLFLQLSDAQLKAPTLLRPYVPAQQDKILSNAPLLAQPSHSFRANSVQSFQATSYSQCEPET